MLSPLKYQEIFCAARIDSKEFELLLETTW